ncbi:aminotransferase class I/II-fold pyridoxal phosphate-dependent enzyme [Conexibacter sp. W3-3-2]|nr:aminotransferase class I/II-fold pyridoxal phosphate-dependent enzyme [Conexibacter sp. W3-3-2]
MLPDARRAPVRAVSASLPLNPVLTGLGTYPFVRLGEARAAAVARGVDVIDLGVGEPREETPAFLREALCDAVRAHPVAGYPLAVGLPELRDAIAAWIDRRYGATVDPGTEIVPTLGSKELVFSLAEVCAGGGRDLVAMTSPGYPVAERGAAFAGCEVLELPLTAERDFLPDLDALTAEQLSRLAILWLNYPNNPTAAVAPLAFYERAAALAREHGFVLASDEAYSELWFTGDPPASALQLDSLENVLVCNTLSKRSSMPGYRSGFAAGDARLVAALRRYRPNVGVAPQEFVQRAAVAAWGDEEHVVAVRALYRAKLAVLAPGLEAVGLRDAGGPATFFRWLALPQGVTGSEDFATELLDETGLVVTPGAYFGPAGEGYVRVALVPTLERCTEAAERLRRRGGRPV